MAMEVRVVGNYTEPRTWGVYRIRRASGTVEFRLGNHPVRQRELEREFGQAELVELHLSRAAAISHRDRLARESAR
jgi:hypothetical protein